MFFVIYLIPGFWGYAKSIIYRTYLSTEHENMNYYAHVSNFEGVGYYQAKPADSSIGVAIPPFEERVEVIVSGYGRYVLPGSSKKPPGVSPRTISAGPGAIIWNRGTGMTIKDSDAVDPYKCMVFQWTIRPQSKHARSSYAIWEDKNECNAFCRQMLGQYHRAACSPAMLGFYIYGRLMWECAQYEQRRKYHALPIRVQRMVHAAEESLEKDWSVGALGEIAGVSESHAYFLFRKHLQTSPHEFLLSRRLNKAKELLIGSATNIKEICFSCGFKDAAHFTRLFRWRFAMTPSVYRETYADPRGLSLIKKN
jgi:AraC-like DNA-binding protein